MYDKREAMGIFARAHAKREPSQYEDRREAALLYLYRVVGEAAEQTGHQKRDEQGGVIVISHPTFGVVRLHSRGDNPRLADSGGPNTSVPIASLPIEFDPNIHEFVGTEEDTYLNPEPGAPRPRRSAVSVITEAVVKMLDKQAAALAR